MSGRSYGLAKGGHVGLPGGCLMEWYSLLKFGAATMTDGRFRVVDPEAESQVKTDYPACTNLAVTVAVQQVNDDLPTADRQRLATAEWLDRIDRARKVPDADTERRVDVRVALAACRDALRQSRWQSHHEATVVEAVEQWLRGDIDTADLAGRIGGIGDGTGLILWLASATRDGSYPPPAVKPTDPDAVLDWLDRLLDAHHKAVAEEGAALDLLDLWEADACAFADEMAAS